MRSSSPRRRSFVGTTRRLASPCVAAALAVAAAGCDDPTAPPVGPSPGTVRAVTLADWTAGGYGAPEALAAVDSVAALGANALWVLVTGYQPTVRASAVVMDGRTPAPGAVRGILRAAAARGLDVALKPHVDVDDGTWRARITPDDADGWFASYRAFLTPWIDMAREEGATTFVVGTELSATLTHDGRWRDLIGWARNRFPGRLTYAASWDAAEQVGFWDALDVIGVDAWFGVTARPNAGRAEMLAGWQPWLARLEALHRRAGRDVLLTEIGYRSIDGAGMHPYDFTTPGQVDLEEQADLYWAALTATRAPSWMAGLVWWNWLARGGGGPADRDYTPAGKPAAGVLRAAWAGASRRVTDTRWATGAAPDGRAAPLGSR